MRQRGLVFPSPVVLLSIIAVAMAAFAFVATRGGEPQEREITPVSEPSPSPTAATSPSASASPKPKPKPRKPPVVRSEVYVEVYNNSGITGLASSVAAEAGGMGWQVVGADNWYGTVPATTVYYPPRLERAARQLALDLGIQRKMPAVGAMRLDRLTVVLTGAL